MAQRYILMTIGIVVLLGTSGCALTAPFDQPAASPEQSDVRRDDGSYALASVPPLSQVSRELLMRSQQQARDGELAAASSGVERAIRLDPNHPAPWLALGQIRFAQGDLDQAEALARRASNFAPPYAEQGDYVARSQALLVQVQSARR